MTLRLNGDSGYVEIAAPSSAGSNTLVLPTGNGSSGQYLQTNGSGTLSWQTIATPTDPAILQVVSSVDKNTYSTTSSTFQDAYSESITTTGTNKVLVIFGFTYKVDAYQNGDVTGVTQIVRGTTSIFEQVFYGYTETRFGSGLNMYLDSPGAGTHTYKLQYRRAAATAGSFGVGALGQSVTSDNSVTLMEVAA